MNSIQCPNCEKALPEYANYCANCGESMTSPGHMSARFLAEKNVGKSAFQGPHFYPVSTPQTPAVPAKTRAATVNTAYRGRYANTYPQTSPQGAQQYPVQDVVTQLHAEDARPLTWQKVLDTPPVQEEDILVSPRPTTSPRHMKVTPLPAKSLVVQRIPPVLFFWLSLTAVLILSLAGVFGVFVSFGHGTTSSHAPTLTTSSNTIAIGATLELHGSNFTPRGRVGLTRDAILPIADTGGASIIQADGKGNFTDTVTISPDWQAGIHVVNAEDAKLHKVARFSLLITGKSVSLRPAHFTLSDTTLDLGTGDNATNSTQTITLSNPGGGQITWQANSDQPWLLLSPDNGTFVAGAKTQVVIAVDRANLRPGSYSAHVNFLSNVGSSSVTVKMQVIPLSPGHDAVLQISPAVLSFTSPDGGAAPAAQTITVSNPGVLPLQWSVSTNASWLTVSPNGGSVQNASSTANSTPTTSQGAATQNVSVSVNTSTLLPGTYNSTITFTGQGQVKNSQQDVPVTVTITPQCSLQVSPSLLTFAGVYQQSTSSSKTINVGVSQSSCTAPIQWSATTAASWLVLGTRSGTTPTYPTVSVNGTGLLPGTYTSSVVFTTSAGTETLPVSFTVTQAASPIMNVSSAALTYTGVVGQVGPASQSVVVANSVGGVLNWQASVATSIGGNWLSVTPASGSLTGHSSTALSVSVAQLSTLTPGTYNGTVTLTGTDETGHSVPGGLQVIPVSFVVQGACTITTRPAALTFTSIVGQVAVAPQPLTIAASGACTHGVTWTATSAASWLIPTPATGTATLAVAGTSNIGISSATLKAGNYASAVTLTAVDSVTHQVLGAPVAVSVALIVQQACTLQAPSVATEAFTTVAGQNPGAQTFSVAVSGVCTGNVIVTPTVTLGSGAGWLTVTPATATVLSGGTATFTVGVIGTSLKVGSYGGSITLAGVNKSAAIAGSPQTVGITVKASSPASLAASAGMASTHGTSGVTAQPVNIANTGGTALTWTAALTNAPSFVSLGTASGTLAAGTNTSTGVVVNAASAVAGNYTANVTITATDPATGLVAAGSPVTVPITISIAPPSMQVNTTHLTYTTPAGSNPAAQSINISNIGGGTLTWTSSTPSASWLSVSPASGSDAPNVTSSPIFNVYAAHLAAGTYTATVAITPSAGSPIAVTVTLSVTAVTPTPTPTIGVTPMPTPTMRITPTSGITPTVVVTPTSAPHIVVTPIPTTQPTPTPTIGVTPTPTTTQPTATPTIGVTPTSTTQPPLTPTVSVTPTAKP